MYRVCLSEEFEVSLAHGIERGVCIELISFCLIHRFVDIPSRPSRATKMLHRLLEAQDGILQIRIVGIWPGDADELLSPAGMTRSSYAVGEFLKCGHGDSLSNATVGGDAGQHDAFVVQVKPSVRSTCSAGRAFDVGTEAAELCQHVDRLRTGLYRRGVHGNLVSRSSMARRVFRRETRFR